jgi:hypothetical protein
MKVRAPALCGRRSELLVDRRHAVGLSLLIERELRPCRGGQLFPADVVGGNTSFAAAAATTALGNPE